MVYAEKEGKRKKEEGKKHHEFMALYTQRETYTNTRSFRQRRWPITARVATFVCITSAAKKNPDDAAARREEKNGKERAGAAAHW